MDKSQQKPVDYIYRKNILMIFSGVWARGGVETKKRMLKMTGPPLEQTKCPEARSYASSSGSPFHNKNKRHFLPFCNKALKYGSLNSKPCILYTNVYSK